MLDERRSYEWVPAFLRHTPFSEGEVRALLRISRLEYERAVEAGLLKKGVTDLEDPFSRHSGHSIWDMSLLASAIHLQVDPYRDRRWLEQINETLDDLAIEIDQGAFELPFAFSEMSGERAPSESDLWSLLLRPKVVSIDTKEQDQSLFTVLSSLISVLIARSLQIATIEPMNRCSDGTPALKVQPDLFPSETQAGRNSSPIARCGHTQDGIAERRVHRQNLAASSGAAVRYSGTCLYFYGPDLITSKCRWPQ